MAIIEHTVGTSLILSLNRPDAGNAVDLDTAQALHERLSRCRGDRGVRTIIVTGSGDRFFCTGGDVKRYRALRDGAELTAVFGKIRTLLDVLEGLEQPVIAALNGYVIGGGVELALACDIRIAHTSARLSLPQSRLGIIPGWNGIERLVETVGRSAAMRMLWSGRQYSAQEALRLGLVDEVVSEGSVLDAALRCAAEFDRAAPMTLGAVKRCVLQTLRGTSEQSRGQASDLLEQLWFSAEHREAEAAFAEKRLPNFATGQ